MAITITNVINREDFAAVTVAYSADADTAATLTNGTHYNFRDTSGAVVAPSAVVITPNVVPTAASSLVGATISAASVICTKHAGAGSLNVSNVIVYLFGPKSKGAN